LNAQASEKAASISVVIPAWNAATSIAQALASAIGQDPAPAEIIVVDDGSDDATAEVAEAFHASVRVIRQPNGGSAAARRTGTAAACGDFVAYLDADDWWLPGWLAAARQAIASDDVHMLVADLVRGKPGQDASQWLPENSTHFPWARAFLEAHGKRGVSPDLFRLDSASALELLLKGYPVFSTCVVARRSSIDAVGSWDPRFRRCQDFDLNLRLARRYPVHWLDRVVAVIGLHGGNSDWLPYTIMQTIGDAKVLTAHLAEYTDDRRYGDQVALALARKCCGLGWLYRQAGDGRMARDAYWRALGLPGQRIHAMTRWAISWFT